MWALEFFIYAMIIFLLALLFGGTLIGYWFTKKWEYEMRKLSARGAAISKSGDAKKP